jgi:hypothetical protein
VAGHDGFVSQYAEPYAPYCGLVFNEKGQAERIISGAPPHLAISAPTRTGKTRRLLAPAAVLHPARWSPRPPHRILPHVRPRPPPAGQSGRATRTNSGDDITMASSQVSQPEADQNISSVLDAVVCQRVHTATSEDGRQRRRPRRFT